MFWSACFGMRFAPSALGTLIGLGLSTLIGLGLWLTVRPSSSFHPPTHPRSVYISQSTHHIHPPTHPPTLIYSSTHPPTHLVHSFIQGPVGVLVYGLLLAVLYGSESPISLAGKGLKALKETVLGGGRKKK